MRRGLLRTTCWLDAVCGKLQILRVSLLLHASVLRSSMPTKQSNARTTMGSDEAPTATTLAPPLTDPYSWFDFYDRDASNTLDQEEVISGLYNTLQVAQKNSASASTAAAASVDAIRESIQAIWPAFDIDGNGQVCLQYLCVASTYLLPRSCLQTCIHSPDSQNTPFHFTTD